MLFILAFPTTKKRYCLCIVTSTMLEYIRGVLSMFTLAKREGSWNPTDKSALIMCKYALF